MRHRMLYIAPSHRAIIHPNQRTIPLPDLDATLIIETPDSLRHPPERALRGITLCYAHGLGYLDRNTEQLVLTRLRDCQHERPTNKIDLGAYIITPAL